MRPEDRADMWLGMLGEYLQGKLADIDAIVTAAEDRARRIPEPPDLARDVQVGLEHEAWLHIRAALVESDLAALKDDRR